MSERSELHVTSAPRLGMGQVFCDGPEARSWA
jgi:hypothetical protein